MWHGLCDSRLGQTTYVLFAIFFASNAFAPMPTGTLEPMPSGACGTTTFAAWDGLCSGCTEMGEPFGVEVVDMSSEFSDPSTCVARVCVQV